MLDSNKSTNINKKSHFKALVYISYDTYDFTIRYNMIHMICTLYRTIYDHLQYSDTTWIVWYITFYTQYWQLWVYWSQKWAIVLLYFLLKVKNNLQNGRIVFIILLIICSDERIHLFFWKFPPNYRRSLPFISFCPSTYN